MRLLWRTQDPIEQAVARITATRVQRAGTVPDGPVLVAVDGSQASQAAYAWAAWLARDHEVQTVAIDDADGERLRDTDSVLREAAIRLGALGLPALPRHLPGPPAGEVLREAERIGASLVVLGAARQEEVSAGPPSVARQVKWGIRGDLLLARSEPPPTEILVGVDGTPASLLAARRAAAIARRASCGLRIVHADRDGERAGDWLEGTHEGLPFRAQAARGEPLAVLLDTASREHADLVAVGCATHGRAAPWQPGCLSDQVAEHASASVLVCRSP